MSKEPSDHADETLAFYTTDQLVNELLKRFDTAVFVGDTRASGAGDTKFAVWDRHDKDFLRAFGLLDWSKFRLMVLLDQLSKPADLDFLND